VTAPAIVSLVREGAALTPIQAAAGRLWLGAGAGDIEDVRRVIEDYWREHGGDGAYWALMSARMSCDACGETYKLENLSICPNCFRTRCYRHGRTCACGHEAVG
jgi:hypothetical protein